MLGYETDKDVIDKLQELCGDKQSVFQDEFGYIRIKNKYESWFFEIPEGTGEKVKLLHKNARRDIGPDYHTQFYKKITLEELARYVNRHMNKYMPNGKFS